MFTEPEDRIALADPDVWRFAQAVVGPRGAGCYRLHTRLPDGTPEVLPRILGTDLSGTLYIGASGDVPGRLAKLKLGIFAAYRFETYGDAASHGVGYKFDQCLALRERFPLARLFVSIYRCDVMDAETRPRGHFVQEDRLLSDYRQTFGEWPPLNA